VSSVVTPNFTSEMAGCCRYKTTSILPQQHRELSSSPLLVSYASRYE